MLRICLAGPVICTNQALVDALSTRHAVDLVVDQARLDDRESLDSCDVLVLDAVGIRATLRSLLHSLRLRRPELPIVIVDGGLSEDDKADAFSLGALDYFPAPCHVTLLAERLEVLARARVAPVPK